LFQAISNRDLAHAETVAGEIVEAESKKGHHGASRLLQGCLHPNGNSSNKTVAHVPAVFPQAETLSAALSPKTESATLSEVMLRFKWRSELEAVIKEWEHRSLLETRGIPRRSKLFFYGPPGCGKSLAAQALGNELSLPTYVVRFDAVIGAYLGQTATHLRELFRFAEATPCVLLFDEVDALGKKRGNPLDVGELDRIVIAFMQELEHSHAKGVIIATSNLPGHLDLALWRRFDLVVEFPRPTRAELVAFATRCARAHALPMRSELRRRVMRADNYADAEKLIESDARRSALRACEVKHAPKRRKTRT
jgi:SpoVK/Ycf46/Vps4 family AAA+-type ATPase